MSNEKSIVHLIGHVIYIALYGLLIVFSVLFYNSAHLVALLYVGWIALAFGIAFLLWSSQSRKKGRASREKSSEETLIESGLYACVRHPEFLGHILIIFALALIAQHWISLIIGAMLIVLLFFSMMEEEKRNIEKFGDGYRDYLKRVPRINLFTGIIKRVLSKKGDIEVH